MKSQAIRKFALTAHVVASVGWLGAVASFLALALGGMASQDLFLVRAAYGAMAAIGWYVLLPLALASLITGLVESLGTRWGLLRHYWVVIKLGLTVLATGLLLLHMRPIDAMAGEAARRVIQPGELRELRLQLVAQAAAALVLLVFVTGLAVYKPQGLTPYGQRKARGQSSVGD